MTFPPYSSAQHIYHPHFSTKNFQIPDISAPDSPKCAGDLRFTGMLIADFRDVTTIWWPVSKKIKCTCIRRFSRVVAQILS
jgi:hypothetical protein